MVSYTYDNLGRMVATSANGETQAEYHYSTDGKLSAIEAKGQRYQYIYDALDRLIYSGQSDSDGTMVLETRQEYDLENRLTEQTIRMGDTAYTESYVYDSYDRLESMTTGNGDTVTPNEVSRTTADRNSIAESKLTHQQQNSLGALCNVPRLSFWL